MFNDSSDENYIYKYLFYIRFTEKFYSGNVLAEGDNDSRSNVSRCDVKLNRDLNVKASSINFKPDTVLRDIIITGNDKQVE